MGRPARYVRLFRHGRGLRYRDDALIHCGDKFRRSALLYDLCVSQGPLAHAQQLRSLRLRNKRQICRLVGSAVAAMVHVGDSRGGHCPLRLIEVPSVKIKTEHKA